MEGEARLRPGPHPNPTDDAASATSYTFRLEDAAGAQHDGTLSVSTNGRALTLSTRVSHAASAATSDDGAGGTSASAVYRLMRIDRSFDERSRPCTPAEAVGDAPSTSVSGRGSSSGHGELPASGGFPGASLDLGDNGVVQTLWLGDELSALEHLSAASFLAHGHQVNKRLRVCISPSWGSGGIGCGMVPQSQTTPISDARAGGAVRGHQVHLYTYNPELRHVPDGVVLKNACSIMADDTQNRPYK